MPRRISPLSDIIAVIKLYRLIKEIDPTIVHANFPKEGVLGSNCSTIGQGAGNSVWYERSTL